MPRLILLLPLSPIAAVLVASASHRSAPPARTELWVFTAPWDPRSDSSLRVNAARIDVAVTGWIALDSNTAQPISPPLFRDTIRFTHGRAPRRMAIVTSWHGDRFHPTSVRALARAPTRLSMAADAIARQAAAMRYDGLVLDFEDMERTDVPALLSVVKSIADAAHARRISTVVVAVPALDTAAYPARPIVRVVDLVMPMLYDQHWSTSAPGPISEPSWVRSALAVRVAEVGPERIVAALPTFGYRWQTAERGPAQPVSFADVNRMARQAGVALTRDASSNTLHAAKSGAWEIWMTDAGLLSALVAQTREAGVDRIALWRIGVEDPGIWRALAP
jgi:peptidoglycan-N-acetylglucosamine deacetylase